MKAVAAEDGLCLGIVVPSPDCKQKSGARDIYALSIRRWRTLWMLKR